MLKSIPASKDRDAADKKVEDVIAKLQAGKMPKAAEMVNENAHEALSYYAFPTQHWRRIRTNSPLERLMKEIRRRTRVVGASPMANPPSTSPPPGTSASPGPNGPANEVST